MGANNTFDFDQWEDSDEPLIVKNLLGRDWELPGPGQVEAKKVLEQQRVAMEIAEKLGGLSLDDMDTVPADIMPLVRQMEEARIDAYIGREVYDEWVEGGIKNKKLQALLAWIIEQHEGEDEEGESGNFQDQEEKSEGS